MSDNKKNKSSKNGGAGEWAKKTADEKDRAHYAALAETLWKDGEPLQLMNQLRIPAIIDALLPPTEANRVLRDGPLPLRGFRILDVGCGGGFLAEPLAKLGAEVVGLDFVQESIDIAEAHAKKDTELAESGRLHYICATIEEYLFKVGKVHSITAESGGPEGVQIPEVPLEVAFDLVVASEVVQHVADVPFFVRCVVALVRLNGALYFTSVNRTWRAYIMMILLVEYVLRFIPRGTHHYKKFVSPEELLIQLEQNGCEVEKVARGVTYNPFTKQWHWIESTAVCYGLLARKRRIPIESFDQ